MELDLMQTLAFGGIVLLAGYGLRKAVPILGRYNIPPPVIGGLLVALAMLLLRDGSDELPVKFDTTLQSPLMVAFFTTIGFGASLSMLRFGGPQVGLFLVLATIFAIIQNVLGIIVALLFGLVPLFGVLTGSVTLTGGPATGLAFAPLFEEAGVQGAASIAVAAAMAGIVSGGIVGGPIGTMIINRFNLHSSGQESNVAVASVAIVAPEDVPTGAEDSAETFAVLKSVVAVLVAMWAGFWVSRGFVAIGVTLPSYIGAMLVAAVIRNIDDFTGWFGLSARILDVIGAVALSLFLSLALMTLKLWELANLALPLVVSVAMQVVLVVIAARWLVFRFMGRDYEAAVMSGGFIGFMLGTTANAMAVMSALRERHGPAPRAFLVAPMVGAFFIDFTNALIITGTLNILGA